MVIITFTLLTIGFTLTIHFLIYSLVIIRYFLVGLKKYMNITNFQIDQPIVMADLTNAIINTTDVVALIDLKITSLSGATEDRNYSDVSFDVNARTFRGLVIAPPGGIFELKYPASDVIGTSA